MKKVGLFFIGALIFLILSAVLYHTKANSIGPESITPSVYRITPFPIEGSFVDGTDVVLYGIIEEGFSEAPIIMKMGPDGTLRWSKKITSLSANLEYLNVRAIKFGSDYLLVVSKDGDGFYFLKINPTNGSVSTSRKIACSGSYLRIDYVGMYNNEIYVSGAGNCGAGSIQGSFVIWLNGDLTQYSGFSYTLYGIAFITLFPTDSQVVAIGHMFDAGVNRVIKAVVNKTYGTLSVYPYNPQVSTHNFYVRGAVELSGNYYALITRGGLSYVCGLVNLNTGSAKLFSNTELWSINISGSNLLVSGSKINISDLNLPVSGFEFDPETRALFFLVNPTNLTPVSTYKYEFEDSTYGESGMPYSTGHVLIWSGSAFVGFADGNLNIPGFQDWSSATLVGYNYTFSTGSTSPPHSPQWSASNQPTDPVSISLSDHQVTITNIYTYTSGSSIEVPGTTLDGEQVTIVGQVQGGSILRASYAPPERCPTPSVFMPYFGGVSFEIVPLVSGSRSSFVAQNSFPTTQSRSVVTLTITYSKPINPRAKILACTTTRCNDITDIVTINTDNNSITVSVEDGGLLDADGQVNGRIETKHFVYAVVSEEHRKSGGCDIGSGVDYGLLSLLLLPVLAVLRRLGFRAMLVVFLFCLPSFANIEQVNEHIKEGEYEEAIQLIDSIIREKGISEELSLLKSYLLLKTGQIKEAITFVEESLKLIPSDKLRLRLAYLYGIVEDFPKAWNTLRAIKKIDQDYYFLKGFLYYREGQFTKAKYSLSKVTPSSENYQEAQVYLAHIFTLEEDHFRFREAVKRVEKRSEFFETVRDMQKSFEQRKKFRLNLSAGTEYDTNLLGVSEVESKTKTWRYFTSVSATYSGEGLYASARAYLSSNEKGSSLNLNFYGLELEPKKGKLSLPFRFDYITLGGEFYGKIGQVGLAYRTIYGTPYLMVGYQDYLSPVFDFEDRDGYFLTAGYRYEYMTVKFYKNLEVYTRSTNTEGVNWDSNAGGARFFSSYSFSDRLSAGLNLSLEGVHYTNENQAFLKKRRDFFIGASPFLSLDLYRNFGLIASYAHARNLSSIKYYSYRRDLYTLQLIGRF